MFNKNKNKFSTFVMTGILMLLMLVSVSCTQQTVVDEVNAKVSVSTASEMARISLEDFESYSDSEALIATYSSNPNGLSNSVALVESPFADAGNAMSFTYNVNGEGTYSGVSRALSLDAEGAEALAFWFQGDGKEQNILLQLQNADGSNKVYLTSLDEFDPKSTDPQYLEIPISLFGEMELSNIKSFDVYVDGVGSAAVSGTLTIDSVDFLVSGEPNTLVMDDFEGYNSDNELQSIYTPNTNGDPNSIALITPTHGEESQKAMQFTYSLGGSGYSGVYRSVDGYWPGLKKVSLWVKGDGKGQDILLQLSDGASYEAHLNNVDGFNPDSTDWQYLEIPIEKFEPKTGEGTLYLEGIQSFALYVNAVDGAQLSDSVLAIDDVKLTFDKKPNSHGIIFKTSEMSASGNDNLISTLRKNIDVSDNGKLVQVQYETDNSGILDATTDMVPKGIFRKEGTVALTIKRAKVYINDVAYVIDVNQDVTIHVSDLAEPVDVLQYLTDITGKNLITSMHFDANYSDADSIHERISNEFGTYPAFYSADFLTGGTVSHRQEMIDEVIRQWKNGAIVQIMFHVSPPQYTVEQESQGDWGGDQWTERQSSPNRIFSFLYNEDWEELMTEGTELNTNWKLRMDEYASYLQQLEDAGVTVLLRPFHEMNQHVFWWGGRPGLEGTAGLYRMFHDYMEKEKGLTNIIWVWDVQDMPENYGNELDPKFAPYRAEGVDQSTVIADYDAQNFDLFNPGADYYDIIAVDFYDQGLNEPGDTLDHNHVYTQMWYDQVSAIAKRDGKPMFIGETWAMITPETWESQPLWSLCMPWGNRTWTHNATGAEGMKEHYQYEKFLKIEDTPTFATRVKEN